VLDAEEGHARVRRVPAAGAAEGGDGRVVGGEDERGGRARADVGPAVGDRVELAVPIELVAEEVREQQGPRPELVDDLPEPELVDLEEPGVAGQARPAAG